MPNSREWMRVHKGASVDEGIFVGARMCLETKYSYAIG
jgi:hypothetical protein